MMAHQFSDIKHETIVNIITDKDTWRFFSKYKTEYVFHTAAYKYVSMMEGNFI